MPKNSSAGPGRRSALPAAAAAVLVLLTGCSGGDDGVQVAAPATTGAATAQCKALQALLPQTLPGGQKRRATSPSSDNTAAWGDPAITLRCGVAEPGVINIFSKTYDPSSVLSTVVDGVCWITEQTSDNGFRFTAIKQQTYVEMDVPSAYNGQQAPVNGVSAQILKTDPTDSSKIFDCA